MENLPDDFIGYFGTMGRSGHNLYPLNKYVYDKSGDWAAEFDSDAIMSQLDSKNFRLIHYKGVTIVGFPRSLDDERPGSKSLFIVKGELDGITMVNKMKEYPEIYEIFAKLENKFLSDN